jgi:hypothetical protein
VQRASTITVEIATAARLASIQADWADLLGRAESPNAFMNPAALPLVVNCLLGWRRQIPRTR